MRDKVVVSVPSEQLLKALEGVEGVELLLWDMSGEASRPDIDIVVPPYLDGNGPLARLAGMNTELVQWQSIGYDGVQGYLPEGVRFANAATVHETATAELAVGITIAAQRGFGEAVRNQLTGTWFNTTRPGVADKRVLLVGYGGVSKAIEARLSPFEADITRGASSARDEVNPARDTVHVHAIEELGTLVSQSDIVISALPLTEHTRGLFDAELLARMPDDSLLVNVGRGGIVDTDALVA